jgi:hypothetical protein
MIGGVSCSCYRPHLAGLLDHIEPETRLVNTLLEWGQIRCQPFAHGSVDKQLLPGRVGGRNLTWIYSVVIASNDGAVVDLGEAAFLGRLLRTPDDWGLRAWTSP